MNGVQDGSLLKRYTLADIDPLAVCNDGTPGSYYFAPHLDEGLHEDSFVIVLPGGAQCFDEESCRKRWETSKGGHGGLMMYVCMYGWMDGWMDGFEINIFCISKQFHLSNHFVLCWSFFRTNNNFPEHCSKTGLLSSSPLMYEHINKLLKLFFFRK